MKHSFWGHRLLNSRIRSEDTQRSEQILGYFVGPCIVNMMYMGVAGTYLTQFYTDILGLAGSLLVWMPLASKLISAAVDICLGRLIDRTRTAQGKARPWLLGSGFLLAACGILLYTVPRASYRMQIAWVVISYNLFFSLASSVYSLSHSLMVPLSTRNSRQRDTLAMLTSTGTSMIPGMLTTIVMPLLVRRIGVGAGAQGAWVAVMGILSIIAIPATMLEYYFTRERVTEQTSQAESVGEPVSFIRQISACLRDKYWVLIILLTIVLQLCNSLGNGGMLYYCNWVLGNSVASGVAKQILVNMIGQAPMGLGVIVLWPLVRKFGKRRVCIIGFSIAAIGSLIAWLGDSSMIPVLTGLFIRSIGALPTYVTTALLADALDHVERSHGFRADGFSVSANTIIVALVTGLAQTLLLAGIHVCGYIPPESAAQVIAQPEAVRAFFRFCFAGLPVIGYAACAVIMGFFDI